ncbi:hypothetical protein D3C73_1398510 [compost metagenome]
MIARFICRFAGDKSGDIQTEVLLTFNGFKGFMGIFTGADNNGVALPYSEQR